MQTSSFNEKESLEVIREMIEASKQNISDGSIHYLMWGWLVIIASLGHYIAGRFSGFEHPYIFWTILMPLGGVAAVIISRKQAKKARASTMIDRIMGFVWAGYAGPAIITLVLGAAIGWEVVLPLFIMLYGWGTFISGGILKFKPLVIGGVTCFVFALVTIFVPPAEKLLMIGLAVTTSHLIPGYLLRKTEKK